MRASLILLATLLTAASTALGQQTTDPTAPDYVPPAETTPPPDQPPAETTPPPEAPPAETTPPPEAPPVEPAPPAPEATPPTTGPSQEVTVVNAPFGLAWWAWLLLALVVVGIIAAIAIAMGNKERTTVVDRETYRPPP